MFDTAILQSHQAELQLEGDLKDALERREFRVLYQPIVSMASNKIIGFEALVRWHHPCSASFHLSISFQSQRELN